MFAQPVGTALIWQTGRNALITKPVSEALNSVGFAVAMCEKNTCIRWDLDDLSNEIWHIRQGHFGILTCLASAIVDHITFDVVSPHSASILPSCACRLDLSRFDAGPGARLSHLLFECDRAFPAQC
ncbi:hypothetical protein PhaeoP97_02541 [Phaeobacter porticola]|uniref:Uncharacterized protein n=1 Tax=Phaeobacter porticola TaxID=1844006 RepID=A0A1L3I7A9_9RHOB|nr:hypothetical protein PhaeoP97_02541 [Phaeobacter porticola]